MASPHDVLVRAHEIIGEFDIARGSYALNGEGNPVPTVSGKAEKFCSVGAIYRATWEQATREEQIYGMNVPLMQKTLKIFMQALDALDANGLPRWTITTWNDRATDEEIRAAFRKAVEIATEGSESAPKGTAGQTRPLALVG